MIYVDYDDLHDNIKKRIENKKFNINDIMLYDIKNINVDEENELVIFDNGCGHMKYLYDDSPSFLVV